MASIARHDITKRRKNFLPTLLVTVIFWLVLGGLIYFIEPFNFGVIPLFFVLVFLTLLFSFSLLLASTRRGVIISLTLVLFLLLRFLDVGHILNFILLAGLAITIELYFFLK